VTCNAEEAEYLGVRHFLARMVAELRERAASGSAPRSLRAPAAVDRPESAVEMASRI